MLSDTELFCLQTESKAFWKLDWFMYMNSRIAAEILGSSFYCEKIIFQYFQSAKAWKLGEKHHDARLTSQQ